MRQLMSSVAVAIWMLPTGGALAAQELPGLWKITTNVENSKLPKLDPQTRALMRGRIPGIDGQPTIAQTCITPEMQADAERIGKWPDPKGLTCNKKITQMGSTVVTDRVCHGSFDSVSQLRVTRTDDEHIESNFHYRTVIRGKVEEQTIRTVSEFLNADCGDIKPYHPKLLLNPR
jgi:Protein of unknown function (DUF3617)